MMNLPTNHTRIQTSNGGGATLTSNISLYHTTSLSSLPDVVEKGSLSTRQHSSLTTNLYGGNNYEDSIRLFENDVSGNF
jgi:hypothetical protein